MELKSFVNPIPREMGHRNRKAVIVCPGGNYKVLVEKEADVVALRFQAYGFQAFVLNYSVAGAPYPTALNEAAEALAYVRKNAARWDIDPHGIYLCGFSAGGHLAASLAVHWDRDLIKEEFRGIGCRPDGTILCYPIITAKKGYRSEEYMPHLSVDDESKWLQYLSTEDYVGKDTPPCFIWHNADDAEVPVVNSLLYAEALAKNGIPLEAHIFPEGGHGISLADDTTAVLEKQINPVCAKWVDLAIDWLKRR